MRRRRFLQQMAVGASVAPWGLAWAPRLRGQEAGGTATAADWIVHTDVPRNAEVPLPELIESWITPVDRFFVRSHAANPTIDAPTHRVSVGGMVEKELSLSVAELGDRFEQGETTATLTCAGNRRYEHDKKKPVGGVPWREGAIGNANWSGAKLSEVLKAAGVKPEAKHVWFDGLDKHDHKGETIVFGGSIPIEKAMSGDADAMPLLATTMNGEPLTPDHGAPVRGLVPGYIGARSVKWLGKITLSDRPSPNHYVADAYKLVTRDEPLAWAEAGVLYNMPLNSAICTPTEGADVATGQPIRVAGYALPPGDPGVTIAEVQVSGDGGRTWTKAELGERQEFCWTLWEADVEVSAERPVLVARAVDSAGGRQPFLTPWNLKGYMYDAWHRVILDANK